MEPIGQRVCARMQQPHRMLDLEVIKLGNNWLEEKFEISLRIRHYREIEQNCWFDQYLMTGIFKR